MNNLISMSIPEVLLLVLGLIGLLLHAHDHGKPKTGYDNFWYTLIACVINYGLMYWAGLFHSRYE
ncbi:MAG: hypothetical protein NVS3B25_33540 [Hymenobacter sp.]